MFYMPKIVKKNIPSDLVVIMESLIDNNGMLVECPRYDANDTAKLFHHFILIQLYHYLHLRVPVPGTWHMPHTTKKLDKDLEAAFEYLFYQLLESDGLERVMDDE